MSRKPETAARIAEPDTSEFGNLKPFFVSNHPMNDHDNVAVWHPDWWSRWVSVGSLVVACAALWFAKSTSEAPLVNASDDPRVTQLAEKIENQAVAAEVLDRRIDRVADQMEQTTDVLLKLDSEFRNDLRERSDESVTESLLAEATMEDAVEPASTDTTDDANSPAASRALTDDEANSREPLYVVQTALRPLNSEHAPSVTLRNVSDDPIVISRVSFEPVDILEGLPTALAVKPLGTSSDSQFVLVLDEADNTSLQPGKQGVYDRELAETYFIPAGAQIEVHLAIENPEHLGFGMLGNVRLEYNTSGVSEIKNVAIAFVGPPLEAEK